MTYEIWSCNWYWVKLKTVYSEEDAVKCLESYRVTDEGDIKSFGWRIKNITTGMSCTPKITDTSISLCDWYPETRR